MLIGCLDGNSDPKVPGADLLRFELARRPVAYRKDAHSVCGDRIERRVA
jgi:hypothetical protein